MKLPPRVVPIVAAASLVLAITAGLVGEQWGIRGVLWLHAGFLTAGLLGALWAEVANWRARRRDRDDDPASDRTAR